MKKYDSKKSMGHSKCSSKRDVYSNTILLQKKEKYLVNNITSLMGTRKRTTKTQS